LGASLFVLDTRTKIVNLAAWTPQPGEAWAVVAGAFDPLTLEVATVITSHARDGAKLAVVVAEGSETLLNRQARANLIAALGAVDSVLMEDVNRVLERATECGAHATLADERGGDWQRTQDFSRFVAQRQTALTSETAQKSSE
jgi:hypothetical protein